MNSIKQVVKKVAVLLIAAGAVGITPSQATIALTNACAVAWFGLLVTTAIA